MKLTEVKRMILVKDYAPIPDEMNDVKTYLFLLKENEKANDILKEAIVMHNLLAESLWQYKIQYRSGILDIDAIVIVI